MVCCGVTAGYTVPGVISTLESQLTGSSEILHPTLNSKIPDAFTGTLSHAPILLDATPLSSKGSGLTSENILNLASNDPQTDVHHVHAPLSALPIISGFKNQNVKSSLIKTSTGEHFLSSPQTMSSDIPIQSGLPLSDHQTHTSVIQPFHNSDTLSMNGVSLGDEQAPYSAVDYDERTTISSLPDLSSHYPSQPLYDHQSFPSPNEPNTHLDSLSLSGASLQSQQTSSIPGEHNAYSESSILSDKRFHKQSSISSVGQSSSLLNSQPLHSGDQINTYSDSVKSPSTVLQSHQHPLPAGQVSDNSESFQLPAALLNDRQDIYSIDEPGQIKKFSKLPESPLHDEQSFTSVNQPNTHIELSKPADISPHNQETTSTLESTSILNNKMHFTQQSVRPSFHQGNLKLSNTPSHNLENFQPTRPSSAEHSTSHIPDKFNEDNQGVSSQIIQNNQAAFNENKHRITVNIAQDTLGQYLPPIVSSLNDPDSNIEQDSYVLSSGSSPNTANPSSNPLENKSSFTIGVANIQSQPHSPSNDIPISTNIYEIQQPAQVNNGNNAHSVLSQYDTLLEEPKLPSEPAKLNKPSGTHFTDPKQTTVSTILQQFISPGLPSILPLANTEETADLSSNPDLILNFNINQGYLPPIREEISNDGHVAKPNFLDQDRLISSISDDFDSSNVAPQANEKKSILETHGGAANDKGDTIGSVNNVGVPIIFNENVFPTGGSFIGVSPSDVRSPPVGVVSSNSFGPGVIAGPGISKPIKTGPSGGSYSPSGSQSGCTGSASGGCRKPGISNFNKPSISASPAGNYQQPGNFGGNLNQPGTSSGGSYPKPGISGSSGSFFQPGNLASSGGSFNQPGSSGSTGGNYNKPGNSGTPGGSFNKPGSSGSHGGTFNQPGSSGSHGGSLNQPGSSGSTGGSYSQPGSSGSTGGSYNQPGSSGSTGGSYNQPGSSGSTGGSYNQPGSSGSTGGSYNQPGSSGSTGGSYNQPGSSVHAAGRQPGGGYNQPGSSGGSFPNSGNPGASGGGYTGPGSLSGSGSSVPQRNQPMANMMMGMMGMNGNPLVAGSCSAGTFCVPRFQCNPYNGFIIMNPNSLQAVWPNAPKVPLLVSLNLR